MSKIITFMTKPSQINTKSFYPRTYDPAYLKINKLLQGCESLSKYISEDIKSGSTPPAEMFIEKSDKTVEFIKTSAIERHIINVNDLYHIHKEFHIKKLKRSITKPYEIIYSMTGKYMGKAAMCPNIIKEINMSQNSVRNKTNNKRINAFIEIFLNSEINRIQVKGSYSITKQKYMNQNKIASLKIPKYDKSFDNLMDEYIDSFDKYYNSIKQIKEIISSFDNLIFNQQKIDNSFEVFTKDLTYKLFTPTFYEAIIRENEEFNQKYFDSNHKIDVGTDIGSKNYEDHGIPFIKTSDIVNFDVDYHPDCYCNTELSDSINIVEQGDLIFTKDGKVGEVALIGQKVKVILAGGFVILKPKSNQERYGMFLLLSSKYGKLMFEKWSVIASTMKHLRKDCFLDNINALDYDNVIIKDLIKKLQINFKNRDTYFEKMEIISTDVCSKILSNK